jgi:hypothetical protein
MSSVCSTLSVSTVNRSVGRISPADLVGEAVAPIQQGGAISRGMSRQPCVGGGACSTEDQASSDTPRIWPVVR